MLCELIFRIVEMDTKMGVVYLKKPDGGEDETKSFQFDAVFNWE
jgi:hypothetical protein